MHKKSILHTALALAFFASTASFASEQKPFEPEVLTVEQRIAPGPNILVLDQSWKGATRINVMNADDLSNKGILSAGLVGQLTLTKDGKTAYTVSAYGKRITSGPTEFVLEEHDVPTLTVKREIILNPKTINGKTMGGMVGLTEKEDYAIIQNATPATSLSIIDLKAGKEIAEVPTPGCWGVFPAKKGLAFSTICGDGTLAKVEFQPDGSFSVLNKSAPFFDADKDPIQPVAERAGDDLLFVTYDGKVLRMNDSGKQPVLKDKFHFTQGVDGDWAPGGIQLMAYNEPNQVLFVLMHPDAKDGSHKNPAEEVWALDMKSKKLLFRTSVHDLVSIMVSNDKDPVLFGMTEEGTVTRYEMDKEAKFAGRLTKKVEEVGEWTIFGLTGAPL